MNDAVDERMAAQEWSKALELLNASIAEGDQSWETAWKAGWCEYKLGQLGAAIAHFRRACDCAHAEPIVWWGLGVSLMENGDLLQAEVALQTALNVRESALARSDLALVYQRMGAWEKAESVHLEGLKLEPDSRSRLEAYAAFLGDSGRTEEERTVLRRAASASRR
jgi:Flp pilus assembly protein TadD